MSPVTGYESIVFTEDGGFIAGGFAKGEYNSINDIFFKSGGQVDGAFPLTEKQIKFTPPLTLCEFLLKMVLKKLPLLSEHRNLQF